MIKRSIAIFLLILTLGSVLIGCTPKEADTSISSNEAAKIAYADMGITEKDVAGIHVHEGTYSAEACYNVYANAKNASKTYVIRISDGEILAVLDGNTHSH